MRKIILKYYKNSKTLSNHTSTTQMVVAGTFNLFSDTKIYLTLILKWKLAIKELMIS